MKVQAHQIQPGDIVRGIGLKVEFAEPATDFHTALTGTVSVREDGEDETGGYVQHPTTITLPNAHLVNVRRSDEAFRADRIQLMQEALDGWSEDLKGYQPDVAWEILVSRVTRVANMPRGRVVPESAIRWLLTNTEVEAAEPLLDDVDKIEAADAAEFTSPWVFSD